MAKKCFMCGREVTEGILCEKCDKPRKKSSPSVTTTSSEAPAAATAAAVAEDPFPKAPIVPFPVESASPAITSVVNLLVASGVASVLVGPDRTVTFVSDEARRLFGRRSHLRAGSDCR